MDTYNERLITAPILHEKVFAPYTRRWSRLIKEGDLLPKFMV